MVTGVNENYSRKINTIECIESDDTDLKEGERKGENEVEVEVEINTGAVTAESPSIIFTGMEKENWKRIGEEKGKRADVFLLFPIKKKCQFKKDLKKS